MITLEINQLITLIIVLAIAAAASGFIAGLLGIGGGILMVPALYYAFSVLNFDENIIMHLSLGTSLTIIIPTSIMSAKTHYKFKAVNFDLIKSFGLPVVIGIFIGTIGFFFVLFLLYARSFPVVAQSEVKTILKSSGENYKKLRDKK